MGSIPAARVVSMSFYSRGPTRVASDEAATVCLVIKYPSFHAYEPG